MDSFIIIRRRTCDRNNKSSAVRAHMSLLYGRLWERLRTRKRREVKEIKEKRDTLEREREVSAISDVAILHSYRRSLLAMKLDGRQLTVSA